MTIKLVPGGPRSVLLIAQAYAEEGLACPDIDEDVEPSVLLYPRSFVEAVSAMPREKIHDYCFMGGLHRPETYAHRAWIETFARERFTDRSYYLITDAPPAHESLGSFDRSTIEEDVFVPKEVPFGERAFFHEHYFRVLRASEMTLCPAGDRPWSMRFSEAILCRSIPIVSDRAHTGRNERERSLAYHVYEIGDDHVYDPELAEANYQTFIRHQTLMATDGG
jgi:hypothetical protein